VDADHFTIDIEHGGGDRRRIRMQACGPRSVAVGRVLAPVLAALAVAEPALPASNPGVRP
jgi:hypothetical protein